MMAVLDTARLVFVFVVGAVLSATLGRYRFYRLAQEGHGFFASMARKYLERQVKLFRYYIYLCNNKERNGLTEGEIRKLASDETGLGYLATDYVHDDGQPLLQQQRALILPHLDKAIAECGQGCVVVEIGTGNGDVIAHAAAHHPDVQFVGVDFNVRNAAAKHNQPNLRFIPAYALDELETGRLKGSILFASATFVMFWPYEAERYFRAIHAANFTDVLLSEYTGGYTPHDDDRVVSYHVPDIYWFHNLAGYLRQAGFQVRHFQTYKYALQKKDRAKPGVFVWGSTRNLPSPG